MSEEDLKVRLSVLESKVGDVSKDVAEIKDSLMWLLRIILGALVLAALALVIGGGSPDKASTAEPTAIHTASTMRLLDSSGTRT